MLHPLRRADQRKIGGGGVFVLALLHVLLSLLDQTHHPLAGFGPGRLAEQVKALVQTLDLRFGLPEMLLEQFAELVEARRFGHLGKRLGQLLIGIKDVSKLVDQKFAQAFRAFRR
jgi:hypothetical protein